MVMISYVMNNIPVYEEGNNLCHSNNEVAYTDFPLIEHFKCSLSIRVVILIYTGSRQMIMFEYSLWCFTKAVATELQNDEAKS